MILTCPTCAETIPAEEADVSTGLARSLPCNEVFRLAGLMGAAPDAQFAQQRPSKVERPEGATSELAVIGDQLTLLLPRGSNRAAGWFGSGRTQGERDWLRYAIDRHLHSLGVLRHAG